MYVKKIILLLLSMLVALSFAACKNDDNPKATKKPGVTPEPTATSEPTPTPEPTPSPTPKPTREPHSEDKPYYGSIVKDTPAFVTLYTAGNPDAIHLPEEITSTTVLAWQFVATYDFDYVDIAMCTWSQPNGAANFSIYKWNYDYDTTIAGEPLYSKTIEEIQDNTIVKFEFDNPLPPDEYLVYLHDNQGTKIGIWKVPYDGDANGYENARLYINDVDVVDMLPQGRIHYIKTPEVKLLPISDPY